MTEKARHERSDPDFRNKAVGVLMGGSSPESEISRKTGKAILAALQKKGYHATAIEMSPSIADQLQRSRIKVAFIALHGAPGEDGTIQGLLEILRIPYTGSGVLASALALNKVASKKIFAYHGLPTPRFQSFRSDQVVPDRLQNGISIPLPLVIKPADAGSTIGVRVVHENKNLAETLKEGFLCSSEILIEEFISGRELTVGIVNGRPLPLIEIRPKSGFYDYRSKYTSGETTYIVDPDLDARHKKEISALAVQAYDALGCCGAARADFMLGSRGTPYILEINTIPGMTETSLLPMAAGHAGIDFAGLVERILTGAALHTK